MTPQEIEDRFDSLLCIRSKGRVRRAIEDLTKELQIDQIPDDNLQFISFIRQILRYHET